MNIDYLDLIGFEPLYLEKTGSIVSPLLKDINKIGIITYNFYISLMLMTPKQYLTSVKGNLNDDKLLLSNLYDLISDDPDIKKLFVKAFDFFIMENVKYSNEFNMFFTYNGMVDEENNLLPTGVIKKENFDLIRDIILQRNHIVRNNTDSGKIKKKKSFEIYNKILKGREELNKVKNKKQDSEMELGNLISALASNHNSLNIINIWDITIYQLYDQFERQINKNVFEVQGNAIAFNGSSAAPDFKYTNWYKTTNNN
jgi:hypothetical protein